MRSPFDDIYKTNFKTTDTQQGNAVVAQTHTQRRDRELTYSPSSTTNTQGMPSQEEERHRLEERADFIRKETIRLIEIAKTGHYSSVFSAAELLSVLFYSVMDIDPSNPEKHDRDRFVIGKGHAAVGIFALLADLGYFPVESLDTYARLGSPYGDHPDMTKVPGIDFSSGSIGHALSNGCGMAMAAQMSGEDFCIFAMLGDGEMQEGQVWEAALSASHHRLGRVIAIVDRNGYQLDGSVDDVIGIEPLADKWRAFGWRVVEVDGHDVLEIKDTLHALKTQSDDGVPTCVIAKTKKGKGVHYMETEPGWHLGYLDPKDAEDAVHEIEKRRSTK